MQVKRRLAMASVLVACSAFAQHDHGSHGASYGAPADAKKATSTIRVEMSDAMRFTPAEITVKKGDIVRFVAVNKGQVMHEMVLGTMDELRKHAELMKKGAHAGHGENNMFHVQPGKSRQFGWRFTNAGEFYYGCLIPGHFEAGMIGKVVVR